MRILLVARGYLSLKENKIGAFELDQAIALKNIGHDVRVIAIDIRSIRRFRSFVFKSFWLKGIKVYAGSIPCGSFPNFLKRIAGKNAAKIALKKITLEGWCPEIIHAHFWDNAYYFINIVKKYNIPFVVTEHSSVMNQLHIPKYKLLEAKYAYKTADVVVAVSKALAKKIYKNTGIKPLIVANVLDPNVFDCPNVEGQIQHEEFTFVTACNLIESKNIGLLINAFSRLNHKNVKLKIFGDGYQKKKLIKKTKILNLSNKVQFYGSVSRQTLFNSYSNSDCFVLPSRTETFGVSYIEAMAAGLPVIATRCGGPEDFVDSLTGILIPIDDEDELLNAMDYMILNSYKYNRTSIANFTKINFSANQIAEKLTNIFEEVVTSKIIEG